MPKKSNKMRSDGRIAIQVYTGTVNGKRGYKTAYGKTQKEAQAAADEIKSQIKKGIDISASNDTFGFWAGKWLESKKTETSNAQYKAYKNRIHYFKDIFENMQLSKIKLYELQSVIDELAKEIVGKDGTVKKHSLAKKTLGDIAQSAKQVYEYAIANRIIEYNPANQIKIPQGAHKSERRTLTEDEVKMIQDTPHRAQTAAMIMLYAGLRRGEVAALQWSDIDFNERTINVNKAIDYKDANNGSVIKMPKTKSGIRTVPLCDILFEYLKNVPQTSFYVFPSKNNTVMSESAWQRLQVYYMNELNRKYGDFSNLISIDGTLPKKLPMVINTFTFHCIRHTYSTVLRESGIDIVVAKEWMGHSDIKTTLGVYTHTRKPHIDAEAEKFNKYTKCKSDASQNEQETLVNKG